MRAARAYDVGPEALAFDVDVDWAARTEMELDVEPAGTRGVRIPVTVRNLRFRGTVRTVLAPLVKGGPGFGALLVSFPAAPKLGLDVKVAGGELTRVPWLRAELEKAILGAIKEEMLWPRRVVVPAEGGGLSAAELKAFEDSDPLLAAERAIEGSLRDVETAAPDIDIAEGSGEERAQEHQPEQHPWWQRARGSLRRPALA
mmetsp:Transcript_9346/g.27997  ORF Transcript_9346/g.27997 Transcript_9346/m.27997 type:complete len:201 (+) Transcript_9346:462-1064(+)